VKTKKGFTLVELLVVISIIAILLAVLIPSMNKAKETAKRVICSNGKKQIALAVAAYAPDFDGLLPWGGGIDPMYPATNGKNKLASGEPQDSERHPYLAFRGGAGDEEWMDLTGKAIPMRLGCLFVRGVVKDARIFYCPATPANDKNNQFESYIDPLPPTNTSREWGTLPQKFNVGANQWVRVGVTWFPVDLTVNRTEDLEGTPKWTARKFDRLESKIPFCSDRIWNTTAQKGMGDLTHNQGTQYGLNAAFKDGHVVYTKGPKTNADPPGPYGPFDEGIWTTFGATGAKSNKAYLRFQYIIYTAIQP
jgi:prepilin-type N-terminal cleavage/methylation domain-containing protein